MKHFIDRLREMPEDKLKEAIQRQKAQIQIAQRDLATMEEALASKVKPEAEEPKLYHVAERNPAHGVWGIYRRSKGNIHGLFRLHGSSFDRDEAISIAMKLAAKSPSSDFSVQGDRNSETLADAYRP